MHEPSGLKNSPETEKFWDATEMSVVSIETATYSSSDSQKVDELSTEASTATGNKSTLLTSFGESDSTWIIILGVSFAAFVGVICVIILVIRTCRKRKTSAEATGLNSFPEATKAADTEATFHVYEDVVEPCYSEVTATLRRTLQLRLTESDDYEDMGGGTLTAKVKSLARRRIQLESEATPMAKPQSSNSNATASHATKPTSEMEQGQSEDHFAASNTSCTQVSTGEESSSYSEVKYANIVESSKSTNVSNNITPLPFTGPKRRIDLSKPVASESEESEYRTEKSDADYEVPDSDYIKLTPKRKRKPPIYARLTEMFHSDKENQN